MKPYISGGEKTVFFNKNTFDVSIKRLNVTEVLLWRYFCKVTRRRDNCRRWWQKLLGLSRTVYACINQVGPQSEICFIYYYYDGQMRS